MILLTILDVVTIVAMVLLVAWPSARAIQQLSDDIYNQRLQLEELYQRGRNLKQTIQQYRQIQPTVQALNSIYVNRGQELTFVTALEDVASKSNVDQTITLNNTTAAGNTLPFQLAVHGTLNQILTYLGGLEGLDYYINIDTVRFGSQNSAALPQTTAPGGQSLTALFLATAYYKP